MIRAAGAALLLSLGAGPGGAAELDRGDLHVEWSGSLRTLYTFGRDLRLARDATTLPLTTKRDDTWLGLVRLRNSLEATYGSRFSSELVYDVELRTGTALDSVSARLGDALGSGTWLDADRRFSQHRDAEGRHLIYRAWLRYEGERLELTLGRQRIPLGRARLWNPTDLFNPISPLAIQSQQRIGQDAVLARLRLSDELAGVAIWSPMDEPDEHRGALRLELSRPSLDASLMYGYFARARVLGADFATNLGDAALRGEATYTDRHHGRGIWQAVLSLDYEFSLGTGLYALVEHLWNENVVTLPPRAAFRGLPVAVLESSQAGFVDRIASTNRNQTGGQLGYDLTPLLRADVLALYDWHGQSAALFPVLGYSVSNDVEVRAGAQLFWGRRRRSEYGDAANLVFAQLDWFF